MNTTALSEARWVASRLADEGTQSSVRQVVVPRVVNGLSVGEAG